MTNTISDTCTSCWDMTADVFIESRVTFELFSDVFA